MRGLNAVRLASVAVVALFVLPLLLPLVTALPVRAQAPLEVTNTVVTPGGELGFILDRDGTVVANAPTLYFWISTNAATQVTPGDFLIATITLDADANADVIFGTLLVNKTIGLSGTVRLKVSSSFLTGAPAVPSANSFTLVTDAAKIQRALRVRDGSVATRPDKSDFAYHSYFGRSNKPDFLLNLSALGIEAPDIKAAGVFVYFIIHKADDWHYVAFAPPATTGTSDFLTGVTVGYDTTYNAANVSGTINDFQLKYPYDGPATDIGIRLGFQKFNLTARVTESTPTTITPTTKWVAIVLSTIVGSDTSDTIFYKPLVSVGRSGAVNIYPTVTFDYTGTKTVGDTFTITLRNFKAGTFDFVVAFFARLDGTFEELLVRVPVTGVTVDPDGTGTIPNVVIPDNQYGGRVILATVNLTPGANPLWALAGPPDKTIPPVIKAWRFDNDGTVMAGTDPLFAPGELLFVRGRGFQAVGDLRIELLNVTTNTIIPLSIKKFTGFYDNGSWGAVVQIPADAILYAGNSVQLRAYTGASFATTTNRAAVTGSVTLAAGQVRVFIFSGPIVSDMFTITRIIPSPVASIKLGAVKYPFLATWEPEDDRKFTLLVYGAPPGVLRFNVTLYKDGSDVATVALNVPRTGVGSLERTLNVPEEVPYGSYQVKVQSGALERFSHDDYNKRLNVTATAAAFDPDRRVFDKRVFLSVPVNLTIKGFGFEANKAVRFDVPSLGVFNAPLLRGPAATPSPAVASAKGSFEGWIDLPSIITAPGTYIIRIHQSPAEAEIIITIGVPPPFTVRVVTGAAKFADFPLDIWVVAFYGGSIARQDQVVSVSVAVYLRVGATTIISTLTPTVAVLGQAIFHASYTPPSDALGKDLLVVATATGRFSPIAPTDTAADVASVAIPQVRFSDLLAAVTTAVTTATQLFDEALAALNEISGKLDTLSTALGAAVTTIRGDIAAVRGDIAEVKALVLEVNTNVGAAIEAILTVADQNRVVLGKLDELGAAIEGVAGGVAAVRTDVAGLAELLRAANLSLSRLVVDQAGRVVAAISDSEGRIVGAVRAEASAVRDLVSAVRGDVRAVSDALAAFQSGAFSKLDAIASSVDAARGDILRLSTGLTAAATVITDIQGAVREVRTTVEGIATTVDTIKATVDSINAAVPNIATKADVTGAASDVKSAVDTAKSDLSGAVAEAKDTAATSARNWGIINAILIIIAIAILAYATFVARRG